MDQGSEKAFLRSEDKGQAGACPDPAAGHPLHRMGRHDGDDEDLGAEVPGVEREWELRSEPQGRTTSRFSGRAWTADKGAPQVAD